MTAKKGVWKPLFLDRLRETANVSRSARDAGISRQAAYKERDNSDTFRNAWEDAVEEGLDFLEEEGRRRAYEGFEEPIYHQGIEVGTVRKYSDTLMIFLLKGGRPDKYADRSKQEHTGPGGKPVTFRVVRD